MLFRNNKGNMIEIKKYDFPNDNIYYRKIMEVKKKSSKLEKTDNNILKDKNNE